MKIKYTSKVLRHKLFNKYYSFHLMAISTVLHLSSLGNILAAEAINPEIIKTLLSTHGLKIITIDGRKIVKGPFKATSQLVLESSVEHYSLTLAEGIASSALFAAEYQNNPQMTNSAIVNRSTASSSNFSGNSTSP